MNGKDRKLQDAEADLYHVFEYDVPKQVKSKGKWCDSVVDTLI